MKTVYIIFLFAIITMVSSATRTKDLPALASTVHNWNSLDVQKTKSGERRQVLDGKSLVFEELEIHVTTLNPGKAPHGSHTHQDFEELIIVKEGTIRQTIGDEEKILGPGSIVLAMPGNEHGLSNAGETVASYYIIKWKTKDYSTASDPHTISSLMLDWNDFEYTKTSKGGRRHVVRQQTAMVDELEMHVTTLDKGMKSHDQHTHIDEEIILVLKGEVEELIDDVPHKAEAGSLIFLNSMIPHGIRNIGDGPCEYFAIRWIPKK